MAMWICTECGNAENLSFRPDGCSACGGGMETQDERSTAASCVSDEAAIVRLWQHGKPLPDHQQRVIDDIRLANSIAIMGAVYGGAAS